MRGALANLIARSRSHGRLAIADACDGRVRAAAARRQLVLPGHAQIAMAASGRKGLTAEMDVRASDCALLDSARKPEVCATVVAHGGEAAFEHSLQSLDCARGDK